jgi:tetratricopeptide (TPR) repeat protein
LENALIAVDQLAGEERRSLAIDLRIDLRHALTPLGQVQRTLDHLRTADQLAMELNDRSRLGRILSFTANCLLLQAHYAEALSTGERALSIARELGDRRIELTTEMYMVRARICRGECQAAIEMYQSIVCALDERPPDDFLDLPVLPGVFVRSQFAAALAEMGAFARAAARAAEAAVLADASGQPDSIMWANWGIGSVALVRGASADAVRVFDRLLDLCRTHDLDAYASRIMAALGCARARAGQVGEGLPLLEQAEVMGDNGDQAAAARLLDHAAELVDRTGEQWCEPEIIRLKARFSVKDEEEASALLQASVAKAREQSAKLWELRAARDLAELLDGQGKREAARKLLGPVYGWFTEGLDSPDLVAARTLLAEMGDNL